METEHLILNNGNEHEGNGAIVRKIFNLRGKFAIIGLTGRTGSGCSTVAEILSKSNFNDLSLPIPNRNGNNLTNEDRKYQICYNYLEQNWESPTTIKVTYIIIWSCLLYGFEGLIMALDHWFNKNIKTPNEARTIARYRKGRYFLQIYHRIFSERYKNIEEDARKYHDILKEKKYKDDNHLIEVISDFFENKLKSYYEGLKEDIQSAGLSSVDIFQTLGNFIREVRENDKEKRSIIEIVNLVIKFYRYKNDKDSKGRIKKTIFVIDALRNPYEILFLRERYSAFYAMSINTSEEERQRRLYMASYLKKQVQDCDNTEYPHKPTLRDIYMKQNIERCNEMADIYIVNNDKDDHGELKKQLALYLSLILHPGLVTPTNNERTMQIAYTAKYNSGCISRQVGAVITDDNFTIKAIGWNDVPEGQTPCILRNINNVYKQEADRSAYSNYEWTDDTFREKLKDKIEKANWAIDLKGRNVPYCFKDIYNDKKKGQNNQVHTRSLHAEENAFLQIAKYGGQGIKGGKLFTTASPCELCAKKAYQLGIKEIYYIDLYPGISKKHILENGSNCPDMKLFNGAIGRAYIHLYQPLLSYKDELRDLLEPEKH